MSTAPRKARCLLVFLSLLFAGNGTAQTTGYLLDGYQEQGGYGGVEMKVTGINNEIGVLAGLQGGWIFNHSLSLGAAWYTSLSTHDVNARINSVDRIGQLSLSYGGAMVKMNLASHRVVHLQPSLFFGIGQTSLTSTEIPGWEEVLFERNVVTILEPELKAELNLSRHIRVLGGLGWRLAFGLDSAHLTAAEVGGYTASLTVRFGKF
ncbi:hypothetical protein GF324_11300 [bacterium]|nr:hypothetical protein [bacterium]